jgi:hypothetical protein
MRLSLFILGVFAAIVWIASPALAQYASRSDPVHHRQRPPSMTSRPPSADKSSNIEGRASACVLCTEPAYPRSFVDRS